MAPAFFMAGWLNGIFGMMSGQGGPCSETSFYYTNDRNK